MVDDTPVADALVEGIKAAANASREASEGKQGEFAVTYAEAAKALAEALNAAGLRLRA